MPLFRRRPLLRAPPVGGGAYLARNHRAPNEEARQDEAYYEGQQSAMGAPPAMTTAGSPGTSSDDLAKLQQLGQLHDQGVLTDDEFAREKQRIIGRV